MIRLYDSSISGNCYKVRLLLAHLGRSYERIDVDLLTPDARPDDVLSHNPTGRVPLLRLDDGRFLGESNAILFFLATGTELLPADTFDRATTLQWMFFEQNHHEPNIAVARFIVQFLAPDHPRVELLPRLRQGGNFALERMNRHLERQPFFVAGRLSIADISLYAYTHVAGEGGFDLSRYPRVLEWLKRVAAQPGHVGITDA